MPKLKRVVKVKTPIITQAENMSTNLRHKFNKSASVDISFWHMDHLDKPHISYRVYIDDYINEAFDSWSKLQHMYFKLMHKGIKP